MPVAAGFTHARALHLLPFLWCKTDPVSRQRAEGGWESFMLSLKYKHS